ncbi:MAG TPA: hypothetical protein DDW90_05335 [Cyanobacteria bacterium UBA9971]|nr:hypothetical protein [Cyanobacteria bacterium UBA9971]
MNKGLEKEIDYLRDSKMQAWVAALSSFGGSITLYAFNMPLIFKLIGSFIGISFAIGFFDNFFKKGDMIEKRINFLKKQGE